MRLSKQPFAASQTDPSFKIPMEVQLWLTRGWAILPTQRKGVVLVGQKLMRKRDKVLFGLGVSALVMFALGFQVVGLAGVLLIALASLDYWGNTRAPTKFFPAEGEKARTLER